jgi:acyl carrier protein
MTNEHTADTIKAGVKNLVAEITERKPEDISDTAHFIDDLEIDSLMSIEMMVAVNKRYKIELFEEEFSAITNVNEAVTAVLRHLAPAAAKQP